MSNESLFSCGDLGLAANISFSCCTCHDHIWQEHCNININILKKQILFLLKYYLLSHKNLKLGSIGLVLKSSNFEFCVV